METSSNYQSKKYNIQSDCLLPYGKRCAAGRLFEEVIEIVGVVETECIGDIGNGQVGVAQQGMRLCHDALADVCRSRLARHRAHCMIEMVDVHGQASRIVTRLLQLQRVLGRINWELTL